MFVLRTKRRSKIRRKAWGCFSFASNSLKFAENRVVVLWSIHRWNVCTKRPAVVFWSFRRSSGLLGNCSLLEKIDRKRLKTIHLESESFPIVFLNRVYTIENDWTFAVPIVFNRVQSCSLNRAQSCSPISTTSQLSSLLEKIDWRR